MSRENTELVRRAYDAFNRDALVEIAAEISPEFEYVATGAIPGTPAVFRGPEGYREFSAWLREAFDDPRVDLHELIDAGELVVTHASLRGRGKRSGLETSWDVWHVWTMRDGKVARGQAFAERDEALRAAGLSA